MSRRLERVGPYELDRYLGEGATGRVIYGYHTDTRKRVAVKVISKSQFVKHTDLQGNIQREIALMALVDHPNIIKLVDVMEDDEHLYVIMEYAEGGGLFDYLVARQFITEAQAIEFIRQIIFGLEYLHHLGICHRDLKPENILLDASLRVKIADFGFARLITDEPLTGSHGSGSPHYAAPEVLDGGPYDGRAADIWSVGVIFFALLARYLPFDDQLPSKLIEKVKRGVFSMPEFSPRVRDLIGRMMTHDSCQRITIPEIKVHPCFLFGLPRGYVLPAPLELRMDFHGQEIPQQLLDCVTEFGYASEEEFRHALTAKGNNVSKVLLWMFLGNANPKQLPWFTGVRRHPEVLQDVGLMTPNIREERGSDDKFGRHVTTGAMKLLWAGNVYRPGWFVEGLSHEQVEMRSVTVKARHWDVLFKVQEHLTTLNLQWLHPDERTILFRTAEDGLYGTVIVCYKNEQVVDVSVILNSGDKVRFDEIAEKLCQMGDL